MNFLKICCSEWINASRDKRELSVCKELGMSVVVLAKGSHEDKGRLEQIDGYDVRRYTTRPLGNQIPNFMNRAVSVLTWAFYARKYNADIISGHDLDALTIGWISTWFMSKAKKPKLVYDSHEFEIGRNVKRSKMMTWLVTCWERFMINKCELSIMVNDSIADEVQRIHKLKVRPIVVRNIPNKWDIDPVVCDQIRENLIAQIGGNRKYLIMYHGGIGSGRGIEDVITAVQNCDDYGFVILGNVSDNAYYENIRKSVEKSSNIIMHQAVPMNELWKYVGAADVGVVNISPVKKSYYYALPNKFFENIQATTPVIVSDLPEMRRIVEKYNLGLVCKADDSESMKACLKELFETEGMLEKFKFNASKAKEELCWENEKKILYNAYKSLQETL